MSFYAIGVGRVPGIYSTWAECQAQTNKFSNAKFKKFGTRADAQAYVDLYNKTEKATLKRKADEMGEESSSKKAKPSVKLFTDGNCENNGKPYARAGSGVYFVKDDKPVKVFARVPGRQTNGRAEVFGLAVGLNATLDIDSITIRPDAQYILNGVTDPTWLKHWRVNGWKKSGGGTVANIDLWKLVDKLLELRKTLGREEPTFEWAAAHSGIEGNELADRAADAGLVLDKPTAKDMELFPFDYEIELTDQVGVLTKIKAKTATK